MWLSLWFTVFPFMVMRLQAIVFISMNKDRPLMAIVDADFTHIRPFGIERSIYPVGRMTFWWSFHMRMIFHLYHGNLRETATCRNGIHGLP